MSTYDPSPGALRPLMRMHWSAQGWRDPVVPPAAAEMVAAVAAGVMFAGKRQGTHDEWVAAARAAVATVGAREAGDAFLASLGGGRMDLRSALGSFAVARALPEHEFRAGSRDGARWCAVCQLYPASDEDLNVLNFERFKWGGVRHTDVAYAAFDLEQFARAPRAEPDLERGRELFAVLRELPADISETRAPGAIGMIPGNRDQRNILLTILALAGVWRPRWCSTAAEHFVPWDPAVPERAPSGVDDAVLRELMPAMV